MLAPMIMEKGPGVLHRRSQRPLPVVTFVGPMNMGASFNRTSWEMKGDVIGTEMRAFNNLA